MKLQAAFSLVLIWSLLGAILPAGAALVPSSTPLAPVSRNVRGAESKITVSKRKTARVSAAAICTEDLSQIKFQEYYVDWSGWMSEVGDRWANVFNSAYNRGKFHTDGTAFVQFTCKPDGSITEISIARSSGDLVCDRSQIEALVNCMPLPAFPVGSQKKTVTMLYVWEYGQTRAIAKKPAKPAHKAQQPAVQRITITGKLM